MAVVSGKMALQVTSPGILAPLLHPQSLLAEVSTRPHRYRFLFQQYRTKNLNHVSLFFNQQFIYKYHSTLTVHTRCVVVRWRQKRRFLIFQNNRTFIAHFRLLVQLILKNYRNTFCAK